MGVRRVVLITLAAVVALALVIAGGVLAYLEYDDQVSKRKALQSEVRELRATVSKLEADLKQAESDVEAAKREAKSEYDRGYSEGQEAEQAFNEELGLTYLDGLKEGRREVFSGFDGGWEDGAWYLIQFERTGSGPEIPYRYDVTPCELMYLSNDNLYTRGNAC